MATSAATTTNRRPWSGLAEKVGHAYDWCYSRLNIFDVTTASISLWFAAVLVYYRDGIGPKPTWFFAAMAATAALLKVAGVLRGSRRMRMAGLFIGALFWIVLSVVLVVTVHSSITWGGYIVLAVAQGCRYIVLSRGD